MVAGSLGALALLLVVLHTVDGHEVAVNPALVTSLIAARQGETSQHFTAEVRCMINLADGKFVTVTETCESVRRLLDANRAEERPDAIDGRQ